MFVRVLPLVAAALLAVIPSPAHAQLRARLLAGGFDRPIGVIVDPVVPGAVHVLDQTGYVRTFVNGVPRATPFLDLHTVISGGYSEQGLLGLAFPPNAAATGRVFVYFTNTSGNLVVSRFTRSTADPLLVNVASRFDLQWPASGGGRQGFIAHPNYGNHNGGHIVFGPDGFLYLGIGDGGAGDDPLNNAQTPEQLLGKMLRIDVSVPASDPIGYAIPASNPMIPSITPSRPEIWAFGVRNPWRYSFDDFGAGATNALIIGDVGQGDREEIDYEPAAQGGRNYGWRQFEGTLDNPRVPQLGLNYGPHTRPVFEYSHAVGQAITGGYVYRGAALGAAYRGRYFYADCVQGKVWSLALTVNPSTGEATASGNVEHTSEMGGPFNCVSSFARDAAGELYFTSFDYVNGGPGTGRVYLIEPGAATTPGAPTGLGATVNGSTVTLSWTPSASGGSPTGYLLEAGSSQGASNIAVLPTSAPPLVVPNVPTGQYFVRVRATNAAGTSAPSSEFTLTVGCTAPVAPATFTASVASRTVTLNWSVAGGTTTTVIEAGYSQGTTALTFPIPAPQNGTAFANVPPGTYYVRTRAVNACGQGPASVERTIVVQ